MSKVRRLKTGATVGGIPFTRGPLAHLLRNRFYVGEVAFKGEVLAGEQAAINHWQGVVRCGPGQAERTTIHRVAHEEEVAQIIMGTRGLGEMRGLLLGSVTNHSTDGTARQFGAF